ncbi:MULTISPECIES: hypothetical protein [Bradyrhizobium]|uniref:hypothetical protein n=1 Tax=Bradyrhizobium TaxID=374 RepID=UPI0032E474B1
MLGFVQRTYASVLGPEHHAFVARFEGLTRDARCLLVRMINRRGAIFNRSLFSYPEIDDVESAAADLTAAGHARKLGEADYAAFVSSLPKDILVTGAQAAGEETSANPGRSRSSSTTTWSASLFRSPRSTAAPATSSRSTGHSRSSFCSTSTSARPRWI